MRVSILVVALLVTGQPAVDVTPGPVGDAAGIPAPAGHETPPIELVPPAGAPQPPPPPPPPAPAPPSPAEAAPAAAPGPASTPATPDAPVGCAHVRKCRRLTATGLVVGGLGLASLVTGAVLFSRDDEVLTNEPAYVRSTRPPGVVLLTVGSGVALSGALLLVAGYRGRRQATEARSVGRLHLRPGGFAF